VFAPKGKIIAFAAFPELAAKEANDYGFFTYNRSYFTTYCNSTISIKELFKRIRNTCTSDL